MSIETTIEEITPELAAEWLEDNDHNRDLRGAKVSEYAGAIRRGEWKTNGEAIKFDEDGTLIDGQHRLWAVVEADMPITTVVVRGLPLTVQESMDLGIKRSLSDALKLRGEKHPVMLAAVLALKWKYDNNKLRTNERATIPQALAVLKKHPRLKDDAVHAALRLRGRFRVATSVAAVAYYQFSKIDKEDTEAFWEKLVTGENLTEGDPVYVLRRWFELQNNRVARANSLMQFAMLIKAWNASRDGRFIQSLSWRATSGEAFPVPH